LIDASLRRASNTPAGAQTASEPTVRVRDLIDAVDVAKEYYLSLASAERFIAAIEQSQEGDLGAIMDLGLSKDDVQAMAMLRMPSDEGIQNVAQELDQDPILARGMIGKIISHGQKLKQEECASRQADGISDRFTEHYCK
jgi:hypothetical protein